VRKLVACLAIVLAASAVGCARNRDLPPMMRSRNREPVQLTVQNQRFEDAAIWANWRGGKRQRVGLAIGTTSTTFSFPWVSEVVSFDVDFIAAEGYPVDPIEVNPGDHLDLVILNGSTR
jgi:hypothetical protein